MISRLLIYSVALILITLTGCNQPVVGQDYKAPPGVSLNAEPLKKIKFPGNDKELCLVNCYELYTEGLDTLTKTSFWRRMMKTSNDTLAFYSFPTRKIFCFMSYNEWKDWPETQKTSFLDSLRTLLGPCDEKVNYIKGRNHFYDITAVIPQIDRGIKVFTEQNTDPFYAQAILLIESPGKTMKSPVGAHGPFQLMKAVGKKYGLVINEKVDERLDFDKAAVAATKLIKGVCIPYTNAMLEKRNIAWCETDLWYRLLVMHVYHAGAGNVAKAMDKIEPVVGNMDLIKTLWRTSAGGFQNASQNYSQVAIASLVELDFYLNWLMNEQLGTQ
jgi:hypothetical protein